MKKIFIASIFLSFIIFYGCKKTNEITPLTSESTINSSAISEDGINGKKLVGIDFQDGNKVNFYEFVSGDIGIRHFYHAETKTEASKQQSSVIDSKLESLIKQSKSFVDIYNAISPNPASGEVDVLTKAQLKYEQFQQQMALAISKGENLPTTEKSKESERNSALATRECSGDYYGDNYSANWFLNNFCREGAFRFCVTNNAWAYSGRTQTTWFKTSAMAADFNIGARFRGWYWKQDCFFCSWYQVLNWDYTVLPRWVETWYFTGTGYRESQVDGLDPCPRVHFTALWNM